MQLKKDRINIDGVWLEVTELTVAGQLAIAEKPTQLLPLTVWYCCPQLRNEFETVEAMAGEMPVSVATVIVKKVEELSGLKDDLEGNSDSGPDEDSPSISALR